jgi:uncharacterized protein YecT (DUF1311 family)
MEESMKRMLLALAMLLVGLGATQAASFDCGKAGTSFEKAICDTPDASKADETLAQAYATALGGLSKDAADSLKATQHDWLDYAARACSDDAAPIAGMYNGDQQQCLVSTIKSRIVALEASRMAGGYRFYPWERYLVIKDPDATADSYNKVATKHYQTVKIDGSDDVATAFNAMTETLRQRDDAQMGEDAHLFTPDGKGLDTKDASADIDTSTTVKSVSAYRITLETNNYWYGHGAAHGNYGATYDHFVIAEKRPLVASDIFAAEGWEAKLGQLVVDKAKEQLGDDYQGTDNDVPGMAADPGRWEFSSEGLIVNFNPYDVAAYAMGAVAVTIPWNDITDLLAEHAMEIATY